MFSPSDSDGIVGKVLLKAESIEIWGFSFGTKDSEDIPRAKNDEALAALYIEDDADMTLSSAAVGRSLLVLRGEPSCSKIWLAARILRGLREDRLD